MIMMYAGLRRGISIHSLVRGRTFAALLFCVPTDISIHSLVRGRTSSGRELTSSGRISIHSLVRGRTLICRCGRAAHFLHFNPLPRKRENPLVLRDCPHNIISIHSLVRGRTVKLFIFLSASVFQSTPS